MLTVDERCTMTSCSHKTGIYRMVGSCWNCNAEPILVLYTEGHEASATDCPVCGCSGKVHVNRLATDEEIPVG